MDRLLNDPFSGLQAAYLPFDLGLQPTVKEAEGVHVLELRLGAERLSGVAHRDVGIAAERPLFHVDVRHPELLDQAAELREKGTGLVGRGDVWLGDDLDERRAAPIEIH